MKNVKILTERFFIRPFEEADAPGLFEMESDPEVVKYIGTEPLKSLDEMLTVIRRVQKQYVDNGMGRLVIEDRSSGEIMGWTGIKYETEIRDFSYYDLGYRLKRKHWGKGIATETGKASLEYGFNQLNLEVIHAGAHMDNLGSQHVLKKLGLRRLEDFMFEGEPKCWFEIKRSEFK